MEKILFVCTGNTCRSCMAEGFLNSILGGDTQLSERYTVASCGISAYDGDTASKHSIKVLRDLWDIDVTSHRSRRINENDVSSADLIITMTKAHSDSVSQMYPLFAHKVFSLKEYVSEGAGLSENQENAEFRDISDPYGMDIETYRICAEQIKDAVDKLVTKIKSNIKF